METKIVKANISNYYNVKRLFVDVGKYFYFDLENLSTVSKFSEYIKDIDMFLLENKQSKEILGVYMCVISKNKVSGRGIVVDTKHRNMGLGNLLIESIKKAFPGLVIKEVIHPNNIPSLKLYLNNGFIITDFINDFMGKGEPRLLLECHPTMMGK